MQDQEQEPGRWTRLSLADLILWVIGCGMLSAVARAGWGLTANVERALSFSAMGLAIFFGLGLVRESARFWRLRGAVEECSIASGLAWRFTALGLMAVFVVAELYLMERGRWEIENALRLLLPLAGTMVMGGLLAGMTSGGQRKPRRWASLSVVWAGFAAVAMAASWMLIPYLILLALEAVSNATFSISPPPVARVPLQVRLDRASVDAAVVLTCCVFSALWISRDLRRPEGRGGWLGNVGLLGIAAVLAAGAAWLIAVTIPLLHPHLSEGLWMTLHPPELLAILLGFVGVAIAIAARAGEPSGLVTPEATAHPRRPRRTILVLASGALVIVLLDLILSRVVRVGQRGGSTLEGWEAWFGWGDAVYQWVRSLLPASLKDVWTLAEQPEWVVLIVAQLWVAWRVIGLVVREPATRPSPLDTMLQERRTFARFAARSCAIIVLMIAALPTLFVTGLVVLHAALRAAA